MLTCRHCGRYSIDPALITDALAVLRQHESRCIGAKKTRAPKPARPVEARTGATTRKGAEHKYRAVKTVVDGITFPSKKQARRYQELKLAEMAGEIYELRLEVPYELAPAVSLGGRMKPALRYVADFVYIQGGQLTIEDSKGVRTAAYRIKRHLMKSVLGLDILET